MLIQSLKKSRELVLYHYTGCQPYKNKYTMKYTGNQKRLMILVLHVNVLSTYTWYLCVHTHVVRTSLPSTFADSPPVHVL
jgi:hypothetical protein